jgi:nucleoid DNA-binding protein
MAVKNKATAKKKTTVKKVTTDKKVTAKNTTPAITDAMTKTELLSHIADVTELSKKQVSSVFTALESVMERHLKKRGPGIFTLPGLLKCSVVRKPATKARKGINPFTGQETVFQAKPARNVVKIKPLKKVKEMAI